MENSRKLIFKGKINFLLFGLSFFLFQLYFLSLIHDIEVQENIFIIALLLIIYALCFTGLKWTRWLFSVFFFLYALIIISIGIEMDEIILKVYSVILVYFSFMIHHKTISGYLNTFKEKAPLAQASLTKEEQVGVIITEDKQVDEIHIQEEYPSLLKRYQSSLIDGIIVFLIAGMLFSLIGEYIDNILPVKILLLLLVFSYEPIFTKLSATIGQRITGLRVISSDPNKRISLFELYLRYLCKLFLGWISFLSVHSNSRRRAIHDMVANTVVVMR